MTRTISTAAVVLLALLLAPDLAEAQRRGATSPGGGRGARGGSRGQNPSRPTTSPYLNLLRGDGGIGFNYYQRMRPQQEFRAANRQLGGAINDLRSQIAGQRDQRAELKAGLGRTGHVPRFMDLRGYFPGLGRR